MDNYLWLTVGWVERSETQRNMRRVLGLDN